MRLLLWYWGRRGAIPRITRELAQALSARGDIELHLSLSRQSELFRITADLGLPGWHVDTIEGLWRTGLRTAMLPSLAYRFGNMLREAGIEAVLCPLSHIWNPAITPVIRRHGAAYMLMVHDATHHPGEQSWLRMRLMRADIAAADLVATLSTHVSQQMTAVHGIPADRIVPTLLPAFACGTLRARRAPSGRPFRILFFGRILPYKGLHLLLQALQLLRAEGESLVLRIAGSGDLTPHRSGLDGLDVELVNRWIGEDEIGAIFDWADIVVLPYIEASQSGVIPIAIGCGLPVVATAVGGVTEQVGHEQTGLIAPADQPDGLAAAIRRLLREPQLYESLSARAVRQAQQGFSWDDMAEDLVAALRRTRSTKGSRISGPANPSSAREATSSES